MYIVPYISDFEFPSVAISKDGCNDLGTFDVYRVLRVAYDLSRWTWTWW